MRLLILSKPNMLLHNRVGQFLSLPAGTYPEHHTAYGYNAIGFDEAANCWVQDVSAWFDLHSIIFLHPSRMPHLQRAQAWLCLRLRCC